MNLTNKARYLRKNQTNVEQSLWKQLRNKQLHYKFRRQFPIEPYITDFACLELKLIIELDGGQHSNQINYDDDQRSFFLEQRGFKVIRFWNNDVSENITGVLEAIRMAITEITGKEE